MVILSLTQRSACGSRSKGRPVKVTHRLAALVRASVAISHGNTSVMAGERLVRSIVRQSLSRSRVLIIITVLFIFSWYPLYILTLVDPKFEQPSKVYKLLTFLAWS